MLLHARDPWTPLYCVPVFIIEVRSQSQEGLRNVLYFFVASQTAKSQQRPKVFFPSGNLSCLGVEPYNIHLCICRILF
jgi:hypothetical protein